MADLGLSDFEHARARIHRRIVETPLVRLATTVIDEAIDPHGTRAAPVVDARIESDVWLKLECLQVTGSFKARGALNRVLAAGEEAKRGVVTASGGNHGLAVAMAGHAVGAPTTVYLTAKTPADKATKIERWGARVIRGGDTWDDAHYAGVDHAAREGLLYVHPFADPEVIAAQGTIALEVLERDPDIDAFVVAIGGGGLIAGIGRAARLVKPGIRIIGVEPTGAPTLYDSLRAGKVVELDKVTTKAGTLAPKKSDAYTFDIIRRHIDEVVLVTDDEMADAARFLLANAGVGVELSGGAAMAVILNRRPALGAARRPCVIVCGAGTDALSA